MLRTALAAGTLLLLVGCGPIDPLVRDAQEAVKRQLRDPDSAQFRDVRRCDKPNAVQGQVNARNGFGGYVGFTSFLYVNGEVAFLSQDDGLGPFTSFDVDQWNRLNRRCWSDEILRKIEADSENLFGQSADELEREAENAADAAEAALQNADEALRETENAMR